MNNINSVIKFSFIRSPFYKRPAHNLIDLYVKVELVGGAFCFAVGLPEKKCINKFARELHVSLRQVEEIDTNDSASGFHFFLFQVLSVSISGTSKKLLSTFWLKISVV